MLTTVMPLPHRYADYSDATTTQICYRVICLASSLGILTYLELRETLQRCYLLTEKGQPLTSPLDNWVVPKQVGMGLASDSNLDATSHICLCTYAYDLYNNNLNG